MICALIWWKNDLKKIVALNFYIAVSILKISKYSDQGRVTIILDDAWVKLARHINDSKGSSAHKPGRYQMFA